MKLIILNIIFSIVALAHCYDFDDPFYNRALTSDWEEMQETLGESQHFRSRREINNNKCHEKKPDFRFNQCCNTEFLSIHRNQLRENYKECLAEINAGNKKIDYPESKADRFNCKNVDKHREEMTCMIQCLVRKRNLVDLSGDIKQPQFAAWVQDNSKEPWLIAKLDTIIPKCLAKARNTTANYIKRPTDSCNPASLKILHCISKEIQMNCPQDQIKDAKACDIYREKIHKRENANEEGN